MKLKTSAVSGLVIAAAFGALNGIGGDDSSRLEEIEFGGFAFELEAVLPGDPGTIYDAVTGEISDWWDHTFSESPQSLFIEAEPGGQFIEVFNDEGDGVIHATVIYADRGVLLRFAGPLGLSGRATQIVTSYEFEAEGDSTRLKVSVHASGEIEEGWAEGVEGAWNHFIFERFVPHVKTGAHLR